MRDDRETNSPAPRRCLLLTPPGCDAPYDLLDGFRRRNVAVREVADAPSAMAELAAAPLQYMAVILVEPRRVAMAESLMDSIARYFPAVVRWQYQRDQAVRLSAWPANGTPSIFVPTLELPVAPPPHPAAAPEIAVAKPLIPPPLPASDEQALRASAQLTEEELAMLLDDPAGAARKEGFA